MLRRFHRKRKSSASTSAADLPTETEEPRCPECGARVTYDLGCHTYQQNDRWLNCMGCGSAVLYECVSCDWDYTHGLNPRNPRAQRNEPNRPKWLAGVSPAGPDGNARAIEGVTFILDETLDT
jgi:hypothetical protein